MPGLIISQRNIDITVQGPIFSTLFPSTESPISQGGIWTNGQTNGGLWHDMATNLNGAYGSSDTFYNQPGSFRTSDDIAHLKTSFHTFAPAQYARAVIYKASGYTGNGGSHECELLLHFSISSNVARGYECSIGQGTSGTYAFIVRWNGPGGDYTVLKDPGGGVGSYIHAPTTMANGDSVYASIDSLGNIALYQNDIILLSAVDTQWASGQPGMGMWPVDGADKTKQGWASYIASEL